MDLRHVGGRLCTPREEDMMVHTQVAIQVNGLELIALKKLALVSHALANKLSSSEREEQKTLAMTLDEIIRRVEFAAAKGGSL